eukprot:GHVU01054477.1.p1 GENE.GHVU01054477.1~~GHVU01054477.1.p1  ORF type:complete len:454 (+),score=63.17 GHVU01054477.1:70-1431(+)
MSSVTRDPAVQSSSVCGRCDGRKPEQCPGCQEKKLTIRMHSASGEYDDKAELTVALQNPDQVVEKMIAHLSNRFPKETVVTIEKGGDSWWHHENVNDGGEAASKARATNTTVGAVHTIKMGGAAHGGIEEGSSVASGHPGVAGPSSAGTRFSTAADAIASKLAGGQGGAAGAGGQFSFTPQGGFMQGVPIIGQPNATGATTTMAAAEGHAKGGFRQVSAGETTTTSAVGGQTPSTSYSPLVGHFVAGGAGTQVPTTMMGAQMQTAGTQYYAGGAQMQTAGGQYYADGAQMQTAGGQYYAGGAQMQTTGGQYYAGGATTTQTTGGQYYAGGATTTHAYYPGMNTTAMPPTYHVDEGSAATGHGGQYHSSWVTTTDGGAAYTDARYQHVVETQKQNQENLMRTVSQQMEQMNLSREMTTEISDEAMMPKIISEIKSKIIEVNIELIISLYRLLHK